MLVMRKSLKKDLPMDAIEALVVASLAAAVIPFLAELAGDLLSPLRRRAHFAGRDPV